MGLGHRLRLCAAGEPDAPAPPDSCSSSIHSSPGARGWGGPWPLALAARRVFVSRDVPRGFAFSLLRRGWLGRLGPRAVVLGPGCPDSPRGTLIRPHCPTPAHALVLLARGRWWPRARRGGQILQPQRSVRRAPTHSGPPGRWHLCSGGAGRRDPHPRSGPSRQPSAQCLPSANKGKTPAPSPPAPTSEREGERVVPSGFSAPRPSDLGVCNPPLSLPPLTYAK